MKKLNIEKKAFRETSANRRFLRSIRIKLTKKNKTAIRPIRINSSYAPKGFITHSEIPRIDLPVDLDLYSRHNHEQFTGFIEKLTQLAQHNDRVIIALGKTRTITAAAVLRFIAEISNLLCMYPRLSFGCSIPYERKNSKQAKQNRNVEIILQQLNFFEIINQAERTPVRRSEELNWKQLSGNLADGTLAGKLLGKLNTSITKQAKAQLYKGAIEAIANSVDHAYPKSPDQMPLEENRWWMLVGQKTDKLTLIICDLGIGIPLTLPAKHPETLLQSIFQKCKILGNSDAEMIRASTFIKRTRTNQTHRGKGGADIRSITEHFPSALLSIRSNRGCYIVAGNEHPGIIHDDYVLLPDTQDREWSVSYNSSICGTMIEWTVSLKDLEA